MINLLTTRERKIVGLLALALVSLLLFFILVPTAKRRTYVTAADELARLQAACDRALAVRDEQARQRDVWERTKDDLEELKRDFFYNRINFSSQIRVDVERIFQESGIPTPSIQYEYDELSEQGLKKIRLIFTLSAPYSTLRRFIHSVENFPRFLILEKIDFVDIRDGGNSLRIRVTLAGYHEI